MTSPLSGTRIGEMLEALDARADTEQSPENLRKSIEEAQLLVFAAMGAEYLRAVIKSGMRSNNEALQHWLTFCTLANPELLGSREKLNRLKPIMIATLHDMRDIVSGKIK